MCSAESSMKQNITSGPELKEYGTNLWFGNKWTMSESEKKEEWLQYWVWSGLNISFSGSVALYAKQFYDASCSVLIWVDSALLWCIAKLSKHPCELTIFCVCFNNSCIGASKIQSLCLRLLSVLLWFLSYDVASMREIKSINHWTNWFTNFREAYMYGKILTILKSQNKGF